MFTYGDGVADLDLAALMAFHHAHGKLATVTTVRSPARFAASPLMATALPPSTKSRRPARVGSTAGIFLNRRVLDYIDSDDTVWERDPVEHMAQDGELDGVSALWLLVLYGHAERENVLEELWNSGKAPWKIW